MWFIVHGRLVVIREICLGDAIAVPSSAINDRKLLPIPIEESHAVDPQGNWIGNPDKSA